MDDPWRPDAGSITGEQLRREIELLNIPISAAAQLLGLSLAGLRHQMNGTRPVSRQTVLLLDKLRETPRRALSALQTSHTPARRSRQTEGVKRALRDIDYFFIHHRWVNRDIEPLVNQLRQMFLKQLEDRSPTQPDIVRARRRPTHVTR